MRENRPLGCVSSVRGGAVCSGVCPALVNLISLIMCYCWTCMCTLGRPYALHAHASKRACGIPLCCWDRLVLLAVWAREHLPTLRCNFTPQNRNTRNGRGWGGSGHGADCERVSKDTHRRTFRSKRSACARMRVWACVRVRPDVRDAKSCICKTEYDNK